ncbi:hypothetical protein Tco_0926141 [Tanacetum coccineum]|uniref:Uncharacterized protein n=1 Tax=Tanacetum coccineum TaxID=301880 RepID=A0ABQ5DA40_9ASTR
MLCQGKQDLLRRSFSSDNQRNSVYETNDADESDMDLPDDNLHGDDDAANKENSLSYNNSPTKLSKSQSKEVDAKAAQYPSQKVSNDNQDPPNNREVGKQEEKKNGSKKFKELIQKDELTIADLEGRGLKRLKVQYNNDVELEYHKYTASITKHYVARYYKECIEDRISERWSKEVRHCHFEALNGKHHWEEDRIYFFKAGIRVVTEGNAYSDLRIKSVVCIFVKKKWGYGFLTSIVVKRSDDKEYQFSYADLPRLGLNDVEDIKIVIKSMVEDIQLGVESYQRTLNLTKPIMFFEGIDQRIPFRMTATHKGVMYENLIDMLSKNKLGSGNKRLKGRDWTDYDVKSSKEMLKKIDEILRHRDQLRRLKEYVA